MKYNPALKPGALWLTVKDALTFNWCLIARKSGEPSKIGKLETATTAGAPIDDAKLGIPLIGKLQKSTLGSVK